MKNEVEVVRVEIPSVVLATVRLAVVGGFGAGKSEPPSEDYLLSNAILVDSASTVLLTEDGIPIVYN